MIVTAGLASLRELSTAYGTEDAYNLLEIVAVNAHNEGLARRYQDRG